MASVSGSEVSDGPVLSLITKKLRALKKKYNRIVQLEESQAQGKTLNKEQEDLLKSKLAVSVLIDEYEKLRQPLSSALQEELSRFSPPPPQPQPQPQPPSDDDEQRPKKVEDLEDLLRLLYFGCLFDVKSQSEFTLLTRTHERECCLTYDTVTDDATTDILREGDLDMISALGGLLTSRPVYSGVSHEIALEGCVQRAKLWLQKADEPVLPGTAVTYAGLREKLNKIMGSDYFTMVPQMKAPVDVASALGKYNSQMQVAEAGGVPARDELQVDDAPLHYQHKEDEREEFQAVEVSVDQSSPLGETEKDESSAQISSGDSVTGQQDLEREAEDLEHNQRDSEHKEQQQYIPRRSYQNQRGSRGGGGGSRRGYPNGRGGRGARGGGGGGYQNGRSQQYYDSGYYPRNNYNYYNTRGTGGGRSGGSAMYNNSNSHGAAAAHGGQVQLGANS